MDNGGERGNDRHEEQLKVGQASGSEVLVSKNVAVGLSGDNLAIGKIIARK